MKTDDTLHGISTPILCKSPIGSSQGTGFFYQSLGQKDPTKDKQWVVIEETWLVTNRHVILNKIESIEHMPESLQLHLRKLDGDKIIWEPIILGKDNLRERAIFHPDIEVDVCAIRILDLLTEKVKSGEKYLQWSSVSKDDFPGENKKIYPEVSSDAIVVGYPYGFYDKHNLFPICKSGIVASRWGAKFNGKPYFLIDAKLFPGSSGSIVLSKPIDFVVEKGKTYYSDEKQFAFLGIFSGEPYQQLPAIELEDITILRKAGYNLGIVWYSSLVEEIIGLGVPFKET